MKRLAILGAGMSGHGTAVLARDKGYEVFVSDSGKVKPEYRAKLDADGIEWEEGRHSLDRILSADEVVKSPAVPLDAPVIKKLNEKGIPVISEIEFAARYTDAKLILITGSNGKTTTAMMTYHILKSAGLNVGLAGNMGRSFSLQVDYDNYDIYVIEISSFQLDNVYDLHANIAVIMNITPDHLDRYEYDFDKYARAKMRITQNMTLGDAFIYWQDDQAIKSHMAQMDIDATLYPFAEHKEVGAAAYVDANKNMVIHTPWRKLEMPCEELSLQGTHNTFDAMAAGISASLLNVPDDVIRKALSDFHAVEHRLEPCGEVNGVKVINNSHGTNVDATKNALDSMTTPTVLILGGVDKGNDYSEILPLVKEKVVGIIAMGKDNKKITDYFKDVVPVVDTHSLDDAIAESLKMAKPGETLLLSPCCASFDLFHNCEERGTLFKERIASLPGYKK